MKLFGLIGYPLSHSFSKKYFTEKFDKEGIADHQYELFPIEDINSLPELLNQYPNLKGINVTIPHKVDVLKYLNEIDVAAENIAAVNCISIEKINDAFYLKGYNTDAFGFEESLKPLLTAKHKKALVFGDGGAARAVKYVLNKLNIEYKVVVRKPVEGAILYSDIDAEIIKTHLLLINTTPLGMSPNISTCPDIDYNLITEDHIAYDLVYNPLETEFIKKASAKAAVTKNGLEMLHLQAEKAWEIWNK
jgi:shikimate dehydrogenase